MNSVFFLIPDIDFEVLKGLKYIKAMTLERIDALVLRRYPLGETDRIYSFFTKQRGKIRAVAKGAARPRSRWTGVLEPFNVISAEVYFKPRTDLHRLSHAGIETSFKRLGESLPTLSASFEILETLDQFIPDEYPLDNLFHQACEALRAINNRPDAARLVLLSFQIIFFVMSGYQFNLERCVRCGKSREGKAAYVSIPQGGAVCSACTQTVPTDLMISRQVLKWIALPSVSPHPGMSSDMESEAALNELQAFVNAVFDYYFERRPRAHLVK